MATGYAISLLTGSEYGWKDAAVDAAAGAVGAGIASKLTKLRAASRGASAIASDAGAAASKGSKVDDIVDSVGELADEVKIGRTAKNSGDFVNIRFKDGTVVNVRVETHRPWGRHGNVDIWEPGKDVVKKHIKP